MTICWILPSPTDGKHVFFFEDYCLVSIDEGQARKSTAASNIHALKFTVKELLGIHSQLEKLKDLNPNLSDRTKCLALYNTHCTNPIGTASIQTPAERRGGQAALRLPLTGSYIRIAQLHRDDSARQDRLNETE